MMGQLTSKVEPVINGLISEERKAIVKREISVCCNRAAIYKQIAVISREEFDGCIKELNKVLAFTCKDASAQVCFVSNHATSNFNWKALTKVGCFEVAADGSVFVKRFLSVIQFWKLRNEILQQLNTSSTKEKLDEFQFVSVDNLFEEDQTVCPHGDVQLQCSSLSTFAVFESVEAISSEEMECCICMERNSDVSLPCAHCFCKQCTYSWSNAQGDNHKTCPICRERFGADDELWEIADAPSKEELRHYMNSLTLSI